MPQYDFQIADYERIFRKRYKLVLVAIVCAVIFSVFFSRMKVPVYTASATVKVDRNSVMGLGMESVIYDSWDNIETQTKVITSFPVLLGVAQRLGMVPDTISEEWIPSDDAIQSKLEGLRGKLNATVSGGTNIIKITATSSDANEAKDIANATAFAYKEFSMRGKRLHATKTKEFVQGQLNACQEELSQAERDVRDFEEQQRIPSVSANTNQVIVDATQLDGKVKDIEGLIAITKSQMEKLKNPYKLDLNAFGADSADSESENGAAPAMGWVSQFADKDPGLSQLNNRLIRLQIERNDQLAYYRKDHPAIRSIEKRIDETVGQIVSEYELKLDEYTRNLSDLQARKDSVDAEMRALPAAQMQYARLLRRLKTQEELNTLLTRKLQETLIAAAGAVDDITVMSLATAPTSATNKSMTQAAGTGVFLGLLLGIILAIVREMFDTSIGTIEDVERTLKLAVLAVIPHISGDDLRESKKARLGTPEYRRSYLVTHFNPKDPTAESYRILRTNLDYLSFDKPIKTILLTSATMQEGKSTTIANLAVAFAQQGKKICLLECNLRRPSLIRIFGLDKGQGTSDILIGRAKWQNCVRSVTELALGDFGIEEIQLMPGLENFHIIPYGHRPPNPAELLSSPRMDTLLAELKEYFDIVLVDAPPILPVADSIVISTKVDGVALIYMVGKAPRNSLRLAKERLEAVQARLLGLVLNSIRPETSGLTYSSYQMYAYGKDNTKKRKPARARLDYVPRKS